MTVTDRDPARWPSDCLLVDCAHLARLNAWPRDARIKFYDKDHYYEIDGRRYPISCTGFVSAPHSPFLRWQVINAMSAYSRQKWGGGDNNSIAAAWAANGSEASRLGTKMHAAIEVYFNTNITSRDPEIAAEMAQFLRFKKTELDPRGIQCVRTEPTIFTDADTTIEIAGSVDFLGHDGHEYYIMDWKRAKASFYESPRASADYCLAPLDKYPQTDMVKYSTQLHTYRYIFQRFYNISVPVKNLYIVSFHALHADYEMVPALDLEAEVADMMSKFPYWLGVYREKNRLIEADEQAELTRQNLSHL